MKYTPTWVYNTLLAISAVSYAIYTWSVYTGYKKHAARYIFVKVYACPNGSVTTIPFDPKTGQPCTDITK